MRPRERGSKVGQREREGGRGGRGGREERGKQGRRRNKGVDTKWAEVERSGGVADMEEEISPLWDAGNPGGRRQVESKTGCHY